MKKQYYGIKQAIEDLLESGFTDRSKTTIRCALNDILDSAGKNGFLVRFEYNQDRAVKQVQRRLR